MSEKEKKVKELSAEEVLQKFDKESDKRELTGVWGKIISAICILFALFQLYTATFGVLDAHLQRAIHLAFGFLLISCCIRPDIPGPAARCIPLMSFWLCSAQVLPCIWL